MATPKPARRTQAERREATIRRLYDAATEALIDVGYAGASVHEIYARAGVSSGGLFRHFATREALMGAVAEDIGHKLMDEYRDKFQALKRGSDGLTLALRLVRQACRSRVNQAWFELMTASRTNPALRKALAPVLARYYQEIAMLARVLLPELAAAYGERFDGMVELIIAIFDGETLHGFVKKSANDDERLSLLREFVLRSVA